MASAVSRFAQLLAWQFKAVLAAAHEDLHNPLPSVSPPNQPGGLGGSWPMRRTAAIFEGYLPPEPMPDFAQRFEQLRAVAGEDQKVQDLLAIQEQAYRQAQDQASSNVPGMTAARELYGQALAECYASDRQLAFLDMLWEAHEALQSRAIQGAKQVQEYANTWCQAYDTLVLHWGEFEASRVSAKVPVPGGMEPRPLLPSPFPSSEESLDGPCPPDGFRWQSVKVKDLSALQWRLLDALCEKGQLLPAVPVDQVIAHVYQLKPADSKQVQAKTEAFKQLCRRTQQQLDDGPIHLLIEPVNQFLRLRPFQQ